MSVPAGDGGSGIDGQADWALETLASLGDGVLVVDATGRFVFRNAAVARLVGTELFGPDPSKGDEANGVFDPDERTVLPWATLPLARAMRGETVLDMEVFVKNQQVPDGAHLLVSASPLRNAQGHLHGAACLVHDITARHRTDARNKEELARRVQERTAELAAAQETLVRNERLAMVGQLAGGVAHQIRNPLAAIMNATYVLRRHLSHEEHPNVDDAMRIIHDEVRHANVIITGLLDYARVRAPDRQPSSIAEIIERVFASDVVTPRIKVERALEDVPLLDVDADQIQGALFNVVRNAVEAMPDGGTLRIEARVDDDNALIAISDTGPGLAPQVRAHLFEPLHSTKPMGVGLGLVTARTFVEAHGGHIAPVDSPVGAGARFEIRLPLR